MINPDYLVKATLSARGPLFKELLPLHYNFFAIDVDIFLSSKRRYERV